MHPDALERTTRVDATRKRRVKGQPGKRRLGPASARLASCPPRQRTRTSPLAKDRVSRPVVGRRVEDRLRTGATRAVPKRHKTSTTPTPPVIMVAAIVFKGAVSISCSLIGVKWSPDGRAKRTREGLAGERAWKEGIMVTAWRRACICPWCCLMNERNFWPSFQSDIHKRY